MKKSNKPSILMICPTFEMYQDSVQIPVYIIDGKYYESFTVIRHEVTELRSLKIQNVCGLDRKEILKKLKELKEKQSTK